MLRKLNKKIIRPLLGSAFVQYIIVGIIVFYEYIVYLTCSIKYTGLEHLEKKDKPFIFLIWHRYILILPFFTLQKKVKLHFLISPNRDGRIISKTGKPANIETVWGTSGKSNSSKIIDLLTEKIKNNQHIGITPDGPKGPIYKVKPGCIFIADDTGSEIIPLKVKIKRKFTVSSWDKLVFPAPFAKIDFEIGEPIPISLSEEKTVDYYAQMLEETLCEYEEKA